MDRFLKSLFLAVLGAFALNIGPVLAQGCEVQYQALVNLRSPFVGSYNVWDTVHGEIETDEAFKDGFTLEGSNNLYVVGTRIDKSKPDIKNILIVEVGRNGRVFWEEVHEVKGLSEIVRVIPHPKGAMVLANIDLGEKRRKHAWLGVFDKRGALLSSKTLKDGNADLTAHDITPAGNGKSFVVAAFSQKEGSGQPGWSTVYRVNASGAVISYQAFVIGAQNAIYDLQTLKNGEFMATGYIHDAGGRKTGWIMRLADNLRMVWQRSYPRGAAAELVAGQQTIDNIFVAAGTALPIGDGNRATWVMTIDENSGDIGWQRYYSGELHFDGRDILTNDDGMISVLMDGQTPKGSDVAEHVRLLTMNPRGVLFVSDEFFNGKGVDAHNLTSTPTGERLIIGDTVLEHQIENVETGEFGPEMPKQDEGRVDEGEAVEEDGPVLEKSLQGWVVAFTGVDEYEDPCKPKLRTLPDER